MQALAFFGELTTPVAASRAAGAGFDAPCSWTIVVLAGAAVEPDSSPDLALEDLLPIVIDWLLGGLVIPDWLAGGDCWVLIGQLKKKRKRKKKKNWRKRRKERKERKEEEERKGKERKKKSVKEVKGGGFLGNGEEKMK